MVEFGKKEFGFGFFKQLYVIQDTSLHLFCSRTEWEYGLAAYRNIFINDVPKIEQWLRVAATSAEWLNEFITNQETPQIESLPMIFEQFQKTILYNLLLTRFLLSSVENLDLSGEQKLLVERLQVQRNFAKYLGFEEQIITKLGTLFEQKTNKPPSTIRLLLPHELIAVLSGETLDWETVEQRTHFVFWKDNTGTVQTTYNDAVLQRLLPKASPPHHEIRGIIACKGNAQGIVKIISEPSEINKMQKGDVLVSINTNPAIMMAIQKAVAVVTDEGGLACHAAIISRELHIPCIVGTKIATRTLKDGDLVEVDAHNGVVRILKKV